MEPSPQLQGQPVTPPATITQRTYRVRLSESPNGLVAELDGPGFPNVWGWEDGFTGTRDGADVQFFIVDENAEYVVCEDLGGGRELCFRGVATGRMTDRTISTVFSGSVSLYGPWPRPECTGDHQLVFTR
jgi:hypothetical protein